MGVIWNVMFGVIAAGIYLMSPDIVQAQSDSVLPGPADRRAEDAAADAKRAVRDTEGIRKRRPAEHERGALQDYRDALERAEWHEEKAVFEAENAAREAVRAERRRESIDRTRKRQDRLEALRERSRRAIEDHNRRK